MCALSAVLTCLLVKTLLSILNVFIAPVSILLKWVEEYFQFQSVFLEIAIILVFGAVIAYLSVSRELYFG